MTKTVKNPLLDLRPDARDASPLYLQLARKIGEAIRAGRYRAHEALPSERALSDALGISRVTARKAIDQMVLQGLVVRRRGSGNYIAPRLEQPLSRLTSFSEELHRRGYTPSSRWLVRAITSAMPDEQLSLGLSPNARVARLEFFVVFRSASVAKPIFYPQHFGQTLRWPIENN